MPFGGALSGIVSMVNAAAAILVTLCWPVYLLLFWKRGAASVRSSEPLSMVGITLQAAGVALMWRRRPLFTPLIPIFPANIVAPVMAVILAVGSVWFSFLALKSLGSQWSLIAEVHDNHRLVKEGLYGAVRHPLYLFFFGLTLATGIVWAPPEAILVGAGVFMIGVWIRIHIEERLLRKTFGAEFEEYVRQVPSFWPRRKPREL